MNQHRMATTPRVWWAVRYCPLLNALDSTTLRQEPVQNGSPLKSPAPLTFPWVYIPERNQLTGAAHHTVRWVNRHLNFPIVTLLDVRDLADILSRVGGVVIQQLANNKGEPSGELVSSGKKIYNTTRSPITARHRGRTQRYTQQLRNGQRLAAQVDSPPLSSHRNICSVPAARSTVRPLPDHAATVFQPGHRRLAEEYQLTGQEAEDELRRWLGIHTFAEEIVMAIGLRDEKAQEHVS